MVETCGKRGENMAAIEYSELPALLAYIMCVKWIILGLIATLFGNPFGLAVGLVGGVVFGVIEYVAAFIVLRYVLHKI